MSVELTRFERLRKEYEPCPDLEKYVMLRDSSVRKMDGFLLMMKIYLDSVRYVFLVRPLGIFSLGNHMLEV